MERQLANLTGLVQKALTQTLPTPSPKDHDSGLSSIGEVNFLGMKFVRGLINKLPIIL